jgi:hypothetical protein
VASIAIADVLNVERLPIDAQDVISRVRLVIAGTFAGKDPTRSIIKGLVGHALPDVALSYFPDPVVYEHSDALHTTYRCVRSLALPEGFNPFLPPDDVLVPDPTSSGFSDPTAVRDGDPETAAVLTAGSGQLAYAYATGTVGFKIRYTSETSDGERALVLVSAARDWGVAVIADWELPNGETNEFYVVLPHDARNNVANVLSSFPGPSMMRVTLLSAMSHTSLEVHEFYPLILNEVLLEDVAKANVRLPALLPLRITVRGYVPPDREHTIEGWPGGDYTGVVAQHQYDLGRTVIDFEQAGAPVGLPAEAIESARERKAAIDREVATASYSLRMGERQ